MNKVYRVSVIIPNWNGQDLLKECLASLQLQTHKNFEVIVVDNNSSDDSVKFIQEKFPSTKVILLDHNYGFARAVNEGIKMSVAEYIILLNNDTTVDQDWIKYLVYTADKYPKVGSVGSKLLNYYHKNIIDGVGILLNEVGQAKSIGWEEKDIGQFENEFYVFGVTGGASLYKRKVLKRVGLFDENYFMYSEEVDWSFRAQFLGYKAIYCPKAIVFHKHKKTANKRPQHVEYWQFKNMYQTIIKDMPTYILIKRWRWLKIILVYINTVLYQLKRGFIWPPIATSLWLLFHIIPLLKIRSKIQSKKIIDDEYINQFLVDKKIKYLGF